MAADEIIRAVHKPTGVIETGPRGYFEEAYPHLYREVTAKDLATARAAADAPAQDPATDDKEGK